MDYILEYKNESINLPQYNLVIAEKFEKVDEFNLTGANYKSKLKLMYDTCNHILGADILKNLVGDFKTCDPNEVNILYAKIVKEYNRPLDEFTNEKAMEQIDSMQLDKIIQLIDSAEKMQNIK